MNKIFEEIEEAKEDSNSESLVAHAEESTQEAPRFENERDPRVQPISYDSEEFLEYVSTEYGYVTTFVEPSNQEEDFEWHEAQLIYLQLEGHIVIIKPRQAGVSTVAAAKAFAKGQLINTDWSIIFTSIKKEEAQNKIGYIKSFIENAPLRFRRKIVYDTKQSIEFLNSDKSTVKIISHAQREARGLHGDHVFDEGDHYKPGRLRDLVIASTPGVIKVGGTISVISTPLDPQGFFREMLVGGNNFDADGNLVDRFQNYNRIYFKWWHVPFYCHSMKEADLYALKMPLRERVYRYGTDILIQAFENSVDEDSFLQEFESMFISAKSRFISPSSILECGIREYDEIFHEDFSLRWADDKTIDMDVINEDNKNYMYPMERLFYENGINLKTYGSYSEPESYEEFVAAYHRGEVSGNIFIGIDIGTTGDASDIKFVEEVYCAALNKRFLIERFWAGLSKWKLPEQQEFLDVLFSEVPHIKAGMDTQGIGHQMGDYFYNKMMNFEKVPMVVQNLKRIFTSLKFNIESNIYALMAQEKNMKAIRSVKQVMTSKGQISFSLEKTATGHSDPAISAGICSLLADEYGTHRGLKSDGARPSNKSLKVNRLSNAINRVPRNKIIGPSSNVKLRHIDHQVSSRLAKILGRK